MVNAAWKLMLSGGFFRCGKFQHEGHGGHGGREEGRREKGAKGRMESIDPHYLPYLSPLCVPPRPLRFVFTPVSARVVIFPLSPAVFLRVPRGLFPFFLPAC